MTTTSPKTLINDDYLLWQGYMCANGAATSRPESTLAATPEHLTIKGALGEFRIEHAYVKAVRGSGLYPWIFRGIRVEHDTPGCPPVIRFQAAEVKSKVVLEQLRQLGYPVR